MAVIEQSGNVPSKEPLILLVSTKFDPHIDFIVPRLAERHIPFVRFNTEDFPLNSKLTISFDNKGQYQETLSVPNNQEITGGHITSVWYRRPAPFEFPPEFTLTVRMFAEEESRETVRGKTVGTLVLPLG